jgi:hypothetical protein
MSAEPKAELGKLRTEQVDEKFHLLDIMSIGELLKAMNESAKVSDKNIAEGAAILARGASSQG